jgi:hypothetical protein
MRISILPALVLFGMTAPARAQVVFDFNVSNHGFTSQFLGGAAGPAPFVWGDYPGTLQPPVQSNYWWYPGSQNITTNVLVSPALTVLANGPVTGVLRHRFAMESQADGGQLQFSRNGGAFVTLTEDLITGQPYNGSIGTFNGSSIGGQRAFTGTSLTYHNQMYETSNFTLGTGPLPYFMGGTPTVFNAGDAVVFRFLAANDSSVSGLIPTWDIGSLTLNNVVIPEPASLLLVGIGAAALGWRRLSLAKRRA